MGMRGSFPKEKAKFKIWFLLSEILVLWKGASLKKNARRDLGLEFTHILGLLNPSSVSDLCVRADTQLSLWLDYKGDNC